MAGLQLCRGHLKDLKGTYLSWLGWSRGNHLSYVRRAEEKSENVALNCFLPDGVTKPRLVGIKVLGLWVAQPEGLTSRPTKQQPEPAMPSTWTALAVATGSTGRC